MTAAPLTTKPCSIKKINKKQMNVDYDEDMDVLYISFGKPKAAICVEVNNGDLIRVDAYTDKILGITIVDFKKRYMESSTLCGKPMECTPRREVCSVCRREREKMYKRDKNEQKRRIETAD